MLLFLHGADSFRLKQRLNILKQGFIQKYDAAGFNVENIAGETMELATLRKALLSGGLFVKKRLVIIQNIFAQDKPEFHEQLAELIKQIAADTILIITAEKIPTQHPLLPILKKAEKIEEFKPLKGYALQKYLAQLIQQLEGSIAPDAEKYLLEVFGDDLWSLNNAVKVLVNYNQQITLAQVKKMIPEPIEENIFALADALSLRQTSLALKLLHDQLASGVNEFYLLSMLARQIRILWQVKISHGQGLDLHPFVLNKTLLQVKNFSLPQLEKLYTQLVELDMKLKTTSLSAKLLLDLWLVEACTA